MVQKYRVIEFLSYFLTFWGAGKISIIIPSIGVYFFLSDFKTDPE